MLCQPKLFSHPNQTPNNAMKRLARHIMSTQKHIFQQTHPNTQPMSYQIQYVADTLRPQGHFNGCLFCGLILKNRELLFPEFRRDRLVGFVDIPGGEGLTKDTRC